IVIVMMENHAFDNYFGTYCQAKTSVCPATVRGLPAGLCVPLYPSVPNGTCTRPFAFTAKNLTLTSTMPHNQVTSLKSWDGGAMDGFYLGGVSGLDPFGYYNGSTIPLYWDLAQQYGLGDNYFSASLSYSLSNHWLTVAGSAPNESVVHGFQLKNGVVPGN